MKNLILLIEDNEEILDGNRYLLERRGYATDTTLTLAGARERLKIRTPDLIILDIMLPDGNGLEFLQELRETSNIPVLLLTGLNESKDIVQGLTLGGDDYLSKPYEFSVMLARAEALLRRSGRVPETLRKGELTFDVTAGIAAIGGEDMLLTQKEFSLLLFLAQHENRIVSAEYLSERVWRQPLVRDSQSVRTVVSRLRKKLKGSGYTISQSYGEGYLFETD